MTVVSEADIAWLAGIIDGEGCFAVKRPIIRKTYKKGVGTPYQLWLVLCNTSKPMMDRVVSLLAEMQVGHQPMRKVWKGDKATRWQYWVHIARREQLLAVTEALLPHLTAKRHEAEIVLWFLRKAVQVKRYHCTQLDAAVLDTMSVIKKNGGEAPADIIEMLREVIPSQAFRGHQATGERTEGVETRRVSPNNNLAHECPTPLVN